MAIIDLRYAIIATQGIIARRHTELGVKRLDGTPAEIRRLVLSELQNSGFADDEVERDIAFQEIYLLEDELPRLELYGLVIVLFATFESVIKRLPKAKWLPSHGSAATLSAGRGDFLTSACRYYRDVLKVPLFSAPGSEEFMRMLSDVRSAIAHANGDVSMLNANVEKRLRTQWTKKYPGLEINDGHVLIKSELVLRAGHVVEEVLRNVIERLKAANSKAE